MDISKKTIFNLEWKLNLQEINVNTVLMDWSICGETLNKYRDPESLCTLHNKKQMASYLC